jgi:hypothetical protein
MINVSGEHIDVVKAALRDIYQEGIDATYPNLQHPILGYQTRELQYLDENMAIYSGLNPSQATDEGENYIEDTQQKQGSIIITPTKYTQSVKVTEEALRFANRWEMVTNQTAQLGTAALQNMEMVAIDILALGFGTTFRTGVDGLALFANNHPLTGGGTNNNLLGNIPLTFDNFTEARRRLNRQTDNLGNALLPSKNILLVVGEENRTVAEQITQSSGVFSSANLSTNPYQGIKWTVNNYLTEAEGKYWFLIDLDRAKNMFFLNKGWMPRFTQEDTPGKGLFTNYVSANYSFDFTGHQWVVGSNSTT